MNISENQKKRKKEKNIGALICGSYGRGNTGDDAILNAIIHELHQVKEDMPVCVISRNPEQTSRNNQVRTCHTFHFREIKKEMKEADIFISGGGSLIQNATSNRSLYYYLLMLWLAKKQGCKVMMYGCGIGPVSGRFHRWAAGRIMDKCVDIITLRDDRSVRELKKMGVKKPHIVRTADPTINLRQQEEIQIDSFMEELGISSDGKYIGFGLRKWTGFENVTQHIAKAAQYAWEKYGLIPVFIPMEYPSDCEAAQEVAEHLTCPYHLLNEQLRTTQTIGLLSRMSIVVGMRLHSLILAAKNGVPCVGISYDVKVDGFLHAIGCEDMALQINKLNAEDLMAQIDRCMGAKEQERWGRVAELLSEEANDNKEQLRKLMGVTEPCEEPKTEKSEQKTKRKRIAIFQSDLHVGGIQKSLVNLMSLEEMDRYDLDVYLFDKQVFFDLSGIRPHIKIHYLKAFPYYFRIVPFDLIMRFMPKFHFDTDEPYDIAIDFSNYQQDCAFGALTVPAKKRVMWIHNDMEIKYHEERKYRILWMFFHSKFHRFTEFVAVSDGIIQPFKNKTGLLNAKVTAIPNLIDTREIFAKCDKTIDFDVDPNQFNIVSMGHLYHQKGYDIMLDQLKDVCEKRKDLACYILGDGPDRQALEEQAKRNGLENVVHFMGYQSNPYPYLNKMDAFYLESRYEGQGMVLWEAKALGLPLIFPKRLEKYNISLKATENIPETLLTAQRTPKVMDDLHEYNEEISRRLTCLIETE